MFDNLSDRLGNVFDKLKGRGALTESDVRGWLAEVLDPEVPALSIVDLGVVRDVVCDGKRQCLLGIAGGLDVNSCCSAQG